LACDAIGIVGLFDFGHATGYGGFIALTLMAIIEYHCGIHYGHSSADGNVLYRMSCGGVKKVWFRASHIRGSRRRKGL